MTIKVLQQSCGVNVYTTGVITNIVFVSKYSHENPRNRRRISKKNCKVVVKYYHVVKINCDRWRNLSSVLYMLNGNISLRACIRSYS